MENSHLQVQLKLTLYDHLDPNYSQIRASNNDFLNLKSGKQDQYLLGN